LHRNLLDTLLYLIVIMDFLHSITAYANPPFNVIGATLFTGYVVLALYCTTSVTVSLYRQYRSIPSGKTRDKEDEHHKQVRDARKRHIKIYAFFASLSFATLSYHMIRFLANSYDGWASDKWLLIRTLTKDTLRGWLWDSTLFETFAIHLVGDGASTLWTQAAILSTWFWNIWMAAKGEHDRNQDGNARCLTDNSSKAWLFFQDNGAIHPAQPDFTHLLYRMSIHYPATPCSPGCCTRRAEV